MTDEATSTDQPTPKPDHEPPAEAKSTRTWSAGVHPIEYTATAKWTVLRKREKPVAEIFHVSYVANTGRGPGDERPVTFVFNGGPGASSAFLHMGVAGPQRVVFPPDGSLPQMPLRFVENENSWLAFTDLVFVDPVGTGFSRVIEKETKEADAKGKEPEDGTREFWGYKRDLESLCEFMSRWLSDNRRWGSPVFISGESYGGYRVGRLVRLLQENAGIGLNGAILISPALELTELASSDYDVLSWIDLVPTMALAAVHHGRSRTLAPGTSREAVHTAAEKFATGDYATFLTRGASLSPVQRERTLQALADLIGLPVEFVTRAEGRVPIQVFTRELLRDERKVVGLYDATITAADPFPDREPFAGPDPTLSGLTPTFTVAINRQLRAELGVETDREYLLLNYEAFEKWNNDAPEHFFVPPVGATDDFRYGMSLNPHMKAFITHGRYDLVTPYYTSDRLRNLMRLDPAVAERLTVRHFDGGHMFYAWEESRRAFTAAIQAFVADAIAEG